MYKARAWSDVIARNNVLTYVLRGHEPVPCDDALTWGEFMKETERRRVAETTVQTSCGREVWVSTVFLGVDRSGTGKEPVLFETMVFDEKGGNVVAWADCEYRRCECRRYYTWEDAEAGHAEVVAALEGVIPQEEQRGS